MRFEDIVDSPVRVCQYLTSFVYNGDQPAEHLHMFERKHAQRVDVVNAGAKARLVVGGGEELPLSRHKFSDPAHIMKVRGRRICTYMFVACFYDTRRCVLSSSRLYHT